MVTTYNNLQSLQEYWREDEIVLKSLHDKTLFISALPRLYNDKAKITYTNKMTKKYPKLDPRDIKISEESNGFSHLYLHTLDDLRDEQMFIRYTHQATYLKNDDVLLYVDLRNADKYRKASHLCFIEKNGTHRYLLKSEVVDYTLKSDTHTMLLSEAKAKGLFVAHWYECGNDTFEVEQPNKENKRVYRAKASKDKTVLDKFDITQTAGHRDTSRNIKVYSTNTNTLVTVKNITSLYKTAVQEVNLNKTERQFINAASSAASTSIDKIKNFKEDGTLPRTKTSFLKLGLYIFDSSIENEDIKKYMAALQSHSLHL